MAAMIEHPNLSLMVNLGAPKGKASIFINSM